MKQFNIPYFAIRLFTLLCYFLPFVFYMSTCTSSGDQKIAYNVEDASMNEKEKQDEKLMSLLDTFQQRSVVNSDTLKQLIQESGILDNRSIEEFDWTNFLSPSENSITGIACVLYHKNLAGIISISISLLLSFIVLFFWPLIKPSLRLYFICANILALAFFIAVNLVSGVTMRIGVPVLALLLLVQLATEVLRVVMESRARQAKTFGY